MFRQLTKSTVFAAGLAKRNASSFARLSVLGRVGQDPVVEQGASGKDFARYSVAVNTSKEGPPSWFSVAVFEPKQIEFATNYIRKGALVHVEANAVNKKFEKGDGSTGYSTNFYQTRVDIVRNPYNPENAENES